MRRLISLFLLIPSLCFGADLGDWNGQGIDTINGQGWASWNGLTLVSEEQTCTLGDDGVSGGSHNDQIGVNNNMTYVGQAAWSNAASKCICKVTWLLSLGAGTLDGKVFTTRIWSMTDTALNAQAGASATVTCTHGGSAGTSTPDCDTWSSETAVEFTFSTCVSLSASTNYAITIDMGSYDGTNYPNISYEDDSSVIPGYRGRWASEKGLQYDSAATDFKVKIYWNSP